MKFKTTCRLFIVACFLVGVIWFINRQVSQDHEIETGGKVMRMTFEEVTSLAIEHGEFKLDCVKRDGKWLIEKPVRARADDGQVQRIINFLEMLPREEVITSEQMEMRALSLSTYALAPPRARLVLRDMLVERELLIGCDAPLGDSVYVKLADESDVISVSSSVLDVIPENLEILRDRTVLPGDVAMTHRLEIQRPGVGFIQLAQTRKGWMIQQPIVARADSTRIYSMLKALYSLTVDEFVWDLSVDDKPDAGVSDELYDLVPDKAPARISVWVGRDSVGQELILGKDLDDSGKQIYAKQRDVDSVYSVSKTILDIFSATVTDLRDRKLFSLHPRAVKYICLEEADRKLVLKRMPDAGWVITEPVQWKADDHVVGNLIDHLTRLSVKTFEDAKIDLDGIGLSSPSYSVQLLSALPSEVKDNPEKQRPGCLLLSDVDPAKDDVFAKFSDDSSVYAISMLSVLEVVGRLIDPLVYKDRTMLAIPADDIKRITLVKKGVKQEIILAGSNEWITNGSKKKNVIAKTVSDILFYSANMRALRIESFNPKSLVSYGLDHPSITLTLGLAGDKGIQKTIMLGNRSKTDGIYAMVQGQDLVFVLGKDVADQMVQDLCMPRNLKNNKPGVIGAKPINSKQSLEAQ